MYAADAFEGYTPPCAGICSADMERGHARGSGVDAGWTQVEPGFTWDDLVLPESQLALLQAASASAESGGHLRLLFTGGPGTGKTMACQILGARTGAPVLSLDAGGKAEVQSEAAEELMRAAGRVGAVLVVDHADVLLRGGPGSRQSGQGMSGAALLERTRHHAGVVVFTTTSLRGLKEELAAQFDCVVDFPFPDRDARKEIWRRLLPDDARLTEPDLEHLARSFQLPGAAIGACCTLAILAAEAQATPVALAHVTRALELEYGERLVAEATDAALVELRRRSGIEEHPELVPAPIASAPVRPARRLPAVGRPLPRRRRAQARPPHSRRLALTGLVRPALVALAVLALAALGFLAGRVTARHTARPAAAAVARRVTVTVTTPAPVPAAHSLSPTPSPSYASALDSVIFPLHGTRATLGGRLQHTITTSELIATSDQLATAYTTAAAQLRSLNPGGAAGNADAALATAFGQTAAAFRALSRAAVRHSLSGHLAAEQALHHANVAGAAAYAELRGLGYRVP